MLLLPIATPNHQKDMLVVVLGKDNLERMKEADPAEVKLREIAAQGVRLIQPTIVICYEEDSAKVTALAQSGDIEAFLNYVNRGWQFRPESGDHDRGPERLSEHN